MTWRPIEEAPRDGTEFLAYDHAVQKYDVCHMESMKGRSDEIIWTCWPVQLDGEYGPCSDEFGYRQEGIRHWMPLPEPPK